MMRGPAIYETGLVELVGVDEKVDNNKYGASVELALPSARSGEILSIALYLTGDLVQQLDGKLLIMDADPEVALNAASLSADVWPTILGVLNVATASWVDDANGEILYSGSADQHIPFHTLSKLYLVWLHQTATSINNNASDNECLRVNMWYRRDS